MSILPYFKIDHVRNKFIIFLTIFCLSLVTFILLFYKLTDQKILRWDEATNVQVVKELSESKNLLLTLDRKPFLEKPPLWYYLTSFSISIFGFNLFALRLVSAISGVGIILLAVRVSYILWGLRGSLLTWVGLLSNSFIFYPNKDLFFLHTFRTADSDSLFICLIMVSFYFLIGKRSKKRIILAGVASGLAVLTKGPLGLLPIASYIIVYIHNRKYIKDILLLILVTSVTFLPWHLLMFIIYPKMFISEYIFYHLFSRSVTALEGHNSNVLSLLRYLNPLYIIGGVISIRNKNYLIRKEKYKNFLVIFVGTTLLLFVLMIIQTRLPWYVLPAYPLLSILVGGVVM